MSRRSNSIMPANMEESTDGAMVPYSPMAQAGRAADTAASRRLFDEYHERISANTRRRHLAALASFAEYLQAAGIGEIPAEVLASDPVVWRDVSWGLVKGYVRWLVNQGYAIRTVNVRLSSVKVYAELAHEAGLLPTEQHSRIRLVKGYNRQQGKHADTQRKEQEMPTRIGAKKASPTPIPEDIAKELKMQPDTPQGRRDALLMCLLLDHGLRVSEVADLRVEHVNLQEGTFTFYRRKVDKVQTHRFTRESRLAMQQYLAVYNEANPETPLIGVTDKAGHLYPRGMSIRAINGRVRALGETVGLPTLSPHDCRHFWATMATRAGTHIKNLQDAGGWASPAMPLQYAESAQVANEGVKLERDEK